MNIAHAPGPNLNDICSFGHQLVPGSDPIVIRQVEGDLIVAEDRKLLRRHAPYGLASSVSRTDPKKMVAYPCDHGLPESDVPSVDVPIPSFRGRSYGRGHHLTYTSRQVGPLSIVEARCPVCRGEPAPDWRT